MKENLWVVFLFLFPCSVFAAGSLDIIINEIAWMGTAANSADEWIELYNNTNQDINLENWGLYEAGGETLIEPLTGVIKAKSYYLIERTDDNTINDIPASQEPSGWGGYGLKNSGEHLQLLDKNSVIIDEVDCSGGWFAGESSPDYKTMERKNAQGLGSNPNNWSTNNGSIINGRDTEGNSINGTPKAENSVAVQIESFLEEPKSQTESESQSIKESQPKLAIPQENEPLPEETTEKSLPESEPIVYPSGLIINEILPSPEGPDDEEEWIEIFNQNNFEVNLFNWQITDTEGKIKIYTFPQETKISSQEFLILSRPTTKITLNNSGDGLLLVQPNGNILDTVSYEKAPRGQSYNRTKSGWAWSTALTPGLINIIPAPESKKELLKDNSLETEIIGTEKQLATIKEQIPKSSKSLYIFLIALTLAVLSAIIILALKKKIRTDKI